MSRYSERVYALENNSKKKRIIFTVIIVVLIFIFLGGMVIGARQILGTEGTFNPYLDTATEPQKSEKSEADLLSTLSWSLNAANDKNTVKLSVNTQIDVPDDSIKVSSDDEALVTELKYIKSGVLESVKKYYSSFEGHFGEDFLFEAIPFSIEAGDVEAVSCFRGRLNDEGCLKDNGTLFYTVEFADVPFADVEDSVLFNNFGMDISEKILDSFVNDVSDIADFENVTVNCTRFAIVAKTDYTTGEIKEISYKRSYSVSMAMSFKGDLEELGTQEILFSYIASENHCYTWAGLELSEHELSIEKGDILALEAYRATDEDVQVTWTSSDSDIVTVDEKGYIKGKSKSTQPVTITAEITYLGNVYRDSCTVYVREPVTEIQLNQKKLELNAGDTFTLSVHIKPKKATIQDLLWFSEDENIAAVNENGVVTAIKEGTVKIYAVSKDGYYRSTCVVTVTK